MKLSLVTDTSHKRELAGFPGPLPTLAIDVSNNGFEAVDVPDVEVPEKDKTKDKPVLFGTVVRDAA